MILQKNVGHILCCSRVDWYGTPNPKFHFELLAVTPKSAQIFFYFTYLKVAPKNKKNFLSLFKSLKLRKKKTQYRSFWGQKNKKKQFWRMFSDLKGRYQQKILIFKVSVISSGQKINVKYNFY